MGLDFGKDLHSPEALAVNPVHSVPFLVAFKSETDKVADGIGINGSEAIVAYLINKYREKIPESFMPKEVVKAAKVNEILNFVMGVLYRSTMYQFVYPCMGLMTECQYDLCKRDFALGVVEDWAKANEGDFFFGNAPTVADFALASLFLGNQWVQDDAFELPWKHKDQRAKYPASFKVIDATLALPKVAEFNNTPIGDPCPSINAFVTFTKTFMAAKLPGTGRTFVQDGEMLHPNMVQMNMPDGSKAKYDKPIP
jgi:glutathione S-transferase